MAQPSRFDKAWRHPIIQKVLLIFYIIYAINRPEGTHENTGCFRYATRGDQDGACDSRTAKKSHCTTAAAAALAGFYARARVGHNEKIGHMNTAFAIAAHNEASIIADTVGRLASNAHAVYIIADNATDATARIAANAGARVYERQDPDHPGKGAAISWFVQVAIDELQRVDCLVILDADSQINEGFVAAIEAHFAQGAKVVQAFVCPVGVDQSPTSALAAYSELLSQQLGDRMRSHWGWGVPLRGTGMAFQPSLLREMAGKLHTQVEDIEMSLWLAQHDIRVHFVPQAIVYDPKPVDAGKASRQRARWLQGQVQIWHYYWQDILHLLLRGGPSAWSLLWALLLKPKTLVLAAKAFLLLALVLCQFRPVWLHTLLLGIAGLGVGIDVAYYLSGLLVVKERRFYAGALLKSPLYLMMWLKSLAWVQRSKKTWLRARD